MCKWLLILLMAAPAWAQVAAYRTPAEPLLWCPAEPPTGYTGSSALYVNPRVTGAAPYVVGFVMGDVEEWYLSHTDPLDVVEEGHHQLGVTGDGATIYGMDWDYGFGNWRSCKWVAGVQVYTPDIPARSGEIILSPSGEWMLRRQAGENFYELWRNEVILLTVLPETFDGLAGYCRWESIADTGRMCGSRHYPAPNAPDDTLHRAIVWQLDWRQPADVWDMMPASLLSEWQSLERANDLDATGLWVTGNGRTVDGLAARAFVARLPDPWPPLAHRYTTRQETPR